MMRTRSFFYSPVRRGYIRKVIVHLVQKYFPHYCIPDSISCSKLKIKEYDENNIKTRQQLYRDETLLLLATWKQGNSTLCCRCQSNRPVVDLLPPLMSFLIPWMRCLSSADASIIVVVFFVLIFLLWRLHCCRRFLGPVVYPPPPPSLYLIPWTHHASLVLCWRLCHCHWVLWPVLIFWRHRRCRKYPLTVNTPAPLPSETFTHTRCIICFLNYAPVVIAKTLGCP